MKDTSSLAHTKWNCKCHIVFAPKYRRQVIYGKIKSDSNSLVFASFSFRSILRLFYVVMFTSFIMSMPAFLADNSKACLVTAKERILYVFVLEESFSCLLIVMFVILLQGDTSERNRRINSRYIKQPTQYKAPKWGFFHEILLN